MEFKSKNGYYKFYNKDGKCARIKFRDNLDSYKGSIFVKFKRDDEETWSYHSPNKKFENIFEIIKFLLKNTESDCVIFEVFSSEH